MRQSFKKEMAKIQKSREDVISDVLRRLHEAQDGLTIDKPSKKQGMEFISSDQSEKEM